MNYDNAGKEFVPRLFESCKKRKKTKGVANSDLFKKFYSIEIYKLDQYIHTLNPENLQYLHHGPTS